jgi:hypothetical protein
MDIYINLKCYFSSSFEIITKGFCDNEKNKADLGSFFNFSNFFELSGLTITHKWM